MCGGYGSSLDRSENVRYEVQRTRRSITQAHGSTYSRRMHENTVSRAQFLAMYKSKLHSHQSTVSFINRRAKSVEQRSTHLLSISFSGRSSSIIRFINITFDNGGPACASSGLSARLMRLPPGPNSPLPPGPPIPGPSKFPGESGPPRRPYPPPGAPLL